MHCATRLSHEVKHVDMTFSYAHARVFFYECGDFPGAAAVAFRVISFITVHSAQNNSNAINQDLSSRGGGHGTRRLSSRTSYFFAVGVRRNRERHRKDGEGEEGFNSGAGRGGRKTARMLGDPPHLRGHGLPRLHAVFHPQVGYSQNLTNISMT